MAWFTQALIDIDITVRPCPTVPAKTAIARDQVHAEACFRITRRGQAFIYFLLTQAAFIPIGALAGVGEDAVNASRPPSTLIIDALIDVHLALFPCESGAAFTGISS